MRRHRLRRAPALMAVVASVVLVLGVTACWSSTDRSGTVSITVSTTGSQPSNGSQPSSGSEPSASPSTSSHPDHGPRRRPAKGPEITIAFAGDNNGEGLPPAHMANAMADRLRAMKPLLSGADLTVANLETAITSRGSAATKAFTFRSPPSILSGIAHVTVKGLRVVVIGATQVLDSNLITAWTATPTKGGLASARRVDRLVDEVKRAQRTDDIVIVFLHWGTEKDECPNPAQKQLAQTLAAAGTTLVIGGHAHRVQSGGFLGTSLVDYGLGNFGFQASGPGAAHTGILTVTMKGSAVKGYEWHPGLISNSRPAPLTGDAAEDALATWNRLRDCTGLTATATAGAPR